MIKSTTGCLAVLFAFSAACGTTSTITRNDGVMVEAKVLRSDPDSIYVRTPGGTERALARADIADIDHPGNVVAVLGTLLGAYGAYNIKVGSPLCEQNGAAFCMGVFTPAIAGVLMLFYGLAVYQRSSVAAAWTPHLSALQSQDGLQAPAAPFDITSGTPEDAANPTQ